MVESFSALGQPTWVWVGIALVAGFLLGWLIWGGRSDHADDDDDSVAEAASAALDADGRAEPSLSEGADAASRDPCPAEMKLGAVESEIRSARELLAKTDQETSALSEELSGLAKSIAQVNGRLKLIARAVKRAKF